MTDILNNLEDFLAKIEKGAKCYSTQTVMEVLDCLIESCPDDKITIEGLKMMVEKHWSSSNIELQDHFDKILQYYNIKESNLDILQKKYIVEKKCGMMTKKLLIPKNKKRILDLLGGTS